MRASRYFLAGIAVLMLWTAGDARGSVLTIGKAEGFVEVANEHGLAPPGEIFVDRTAFMTSGPAVASFKAAGPQEFLLARLDYLLDDQPQERVGDFQTEAVLRSEDTVGISSAHAELTVDFSLTQEMPFIFTADVGRGADWAFIEVNGIEAWMSADPELGWVGTIGMDGFEETGVLPAGDHTLFFQAISFGVELDFDHQITARLQIIPEPTTAPLLGMAGLAMLRRRRPATPPTEITARCGGQPGGRRRRRRG